MSAASINYRKMRQWMGSLVGFSLLCVTLTASAQTKKYDSQTVGAPPASEEKYRAFFDFSQSVREAALQKFGMPFDFIERHATRFSVDKSDRIRIQVAQYSRNPEVLAKLANDPVELVRKCVARNLATPPAVLISIAKTLADTPESRTAGMNKRESFAAHSLMENPNLPPEAFKYIASFFPLLYRMEPHRNMPLDIFMRYQGAYDIDVSDSAEYAAVQRAKGSLDNPGEILKAMAKSREGDFVHMAAMNAKTPPEVLERTWERAAESIAGNALLGSSHPAIAKLLVRLEREQNDNVAAAFYGNPNTPVDVLRREAKSKAGKNKERATLTLWLMHGEMP